MKLKPTTSYDFTKADLEFVLELAKVGHVHLLSSQVSLCVFKDYDNSIGFSFVDYTGNEKCNGLTLPSNWTIESIYATGHHQITGVQKLSITFKVTRS